MWSLARALGLCVALDLVAPAVSATCSGGTSTAGFVDQADSDMLTLATTKKVEFCKDLDAFEDVADHRKTLVDALGGSNFVETSARESKDSAEMSKKLTEKITPAWAIQQAAPMVIAILVAILWYFCCWSGCPCCKCCRCCAKPNSEDHRRTGWICKSFLLLGLIAIGITIIVGLANISKGHSNASGGVDRMACTTAEFMEGLMGGWKDPAFIGFIPVLKKLDDIVGIFADNSAFLTETRTTLGQTSVVSDAMSVAEDTVKLLADVLAKSNNMYPPLTGGLDSLHANKLCTELSGPVGDLSTALSKSLASALKGVNSQLMTFIAPDQMCLLKTQLVDSMAPPLTDFKAMLRKNMGSLLEGDKIAVMKGYVKKEGQAAVNLVTIFYVLFYVCSLCTGMCFLLREGWGLDPPRDDDPENNLDAKTPAKYNACPHRCACYVWCTLILLIFPVLFFGGLFQAITLPLSSACLMFDDLNGAMAKDIGGILGQNFSGGSGQILLEMIDKCVYMPFPAPAVVPNANLLELIPYGNGTGGPKNMREFMNTMVNAPFTAVFDNLDKTTASTPNVSLSTMQTLIDLRKSLKDSNAKALLLLDETKAKAFTSPLVKLMANDYLGNLALVTGTLCPNATITVKGATQVVPGMVYSTETARDVYGTGDGVSYNACGVGLALKAIVCRTVSGIYTQAQQDACNQFNILMAVYKVPLMTAQTFSCDLWQDSLGVTCDVKDMVTINAAKGQYTGDCLITQADGTKALKRKQIPCNLDTFKQYLNDFDTRFDKTFARVDGSAAAAMDLITKDIRKIVTKYLLDPFTIILDGVTCGFMPKTIQEVINGVCYQGVYGFRQIVNAYLLFGFSAIFLALIMCCLWRKAVTNYNSTSAPTKWEEKMDAKVRKSVSAGLKRMPSRISQRASKHFEGPYGAQKDRE